MPKAPSFIPVKTNRSTSPWRLNIPANLSETGKKQRLFFPTRKKAETAAEQIKTRKANFGNTLAALSPTRISEAAEAFKLLDASQNKVSLLSLVKHHLQAETKRNASLELSRLFQAFISAKQSMTKEHQDKLRNCQQRFAALADKKITDFSHSDFEPVLNKLTPSMRNAELRYLKSVFNFALKRHLIDKNPITPIDSVATVRKEVQTLPVWAVEAVLQNAAKHYPEILAYRVLTIFAGIRPLGEMQKLEWRDIHLDDKIVEIRAEVSKTRRRRFVDLSDNAVAWLRLLPPPSTGNSKVVPFSFHILREKYEANWNDAVTNGKEITNKIKWIHQGARHTYCSNWLAIHQDIDKLVLQSGHTNPQVMFEKYHRGTPKAEAEKFWNIYPPVL
jgi:integrase